jgi:DNA ligase-1
LTSFGSLAQLLERVRSTSSRNLKVSELASYLSRLRGDELAAAVRLIWGRPVPRSLGREPSVGFSTLWRAALTVWRVGPGELGELLRAHGDLGEAVEAAAQRGRVFQPFEAGELSLMDVAEAARRMALADGGGSTKLRLQLLVGLLSRCSPLEAKYLVKVFTGEMRVGVDAGMIEEALARAFKVDGGVVRRMVLAHGDLGEVAASLSRGVWELPLTPGVPAGFMLAEPMASAGEIMRHFGKRVICEFKYDGVRAQAHRWDGELRIFSRRMEDEAPSFPELVGSLAKNRHSFILDGEIVGFRDGRPLPFALLQRRLRRREPGGLAEQIPIAYFVYDILYLDGSVLVDRPLRERRAILQGLGFEPPVLVVEPRWVGGADEVDRLFAEALAGGYEGLMVKDPDSPYTPGRRGKLWVKLKRELDTLDCVVVGAEYGHGKRAGLLSDLIFAVWQGGSLKVIGKAYTGLTDQEILWMTRRLRETVVRDEGFRVWVRPEIVVEVAFDSIQRSDRHESGYALRFPRIKRLRLDKRPEEADSVERVVAILERQRARAGQM